MKQIIKSVLYISLFISSFQMISQIQNGSFKLINADTDTELITFTDNLSWNLDVADALNLVAEPSAAYTNVNFVLSNGHSRQEGTAPYAAYGDVGGDYGNVPGNPTYFGWYPTEGNLDFTVEYLNNGTVLATDTFTITFFRATTILSFTSFTSALEGTNGVRLNWSVNDSYLASNGRIAYSEGNSYDPSNNIALFDFPSGVYSYLIPDLDFDKTYSFAIDLNKSSSATNSNSGPLSDFTTITIPENPNGSSTGYWIKSGSDIYYDSGNVGIATQNIGNWQLAVGGKIRAEEIKVETGWADYVFKEGYHLPTLEEVEKHIQEKGHLINIPSAKEVEENGIQLGEMNKLLLEKIEEQTLYILQQQKQIRQQKEKNKSLEGRLVKLEQLTTILKNQK
nr:hypothetical protein [uncultured Allomuricauda sp.]